MNFLDRYPIFVTPHMRACSNFWTRHLGFVEGFASDWIVWLTTEDGSASIAFMTPDHPSAPPGPEVFPGSGMCFELQVESIEEALAEVLASGLTPEYPLTTEPYGQRRFGFHDPAGLWVDIVEQVEVDADVA
jgi:catechol 2,3-dioxygenase-like lactoylglutathione lyase family enzyme